MLDPLRYASRIAYSSETVLRFTYEQSKLYCEGNSVFVEAGVAAGAQIIAMRAACPTKKIYALDSFQGLPMPSNKDDQMPGIAFLTKAEQMALPDPGKQALVSSGAVVVPLVDFWVHQFYAFGQDPENIIAVPGWFEETVPKLSETIEPISILRLDSDLYNSTYVCLKYLYPKVIKGGLVIIDDHALPGCRQAVQDYFREVIDVYAVPNVKYIKGNDSEVAYWQKEYL